MIIDAHCHVGAVWYEPAEALLFQMDRNGVERAVLIQMLGQFDNRYQQDCVARWPDRFVSVVAVDPARPDAAELLRTLANDGARGVRLRPGARSPGEDPLLIWRTAQDLGLAVSCVGTTAQFTAPDFAEIVTEVTDLPIVLEHLGGIARPDAEADHSHVWALARFENVYFKVPGLGQLSKRAALLADRDSPFEPGGEDYVRRAVERLSPQRLMWGSDFPVVSSREGYTNALGGIRALLGFLDEQDLAAILGAAAARVFGSTR